MKNLKLLIISLCLLTLSTGCFFDKTDDVNKHIMEEPVKDNYKDKLTKAMNSELEYIYDDEKTELLSNHVIVENEKAVPAKYAFVDFESDDTEELVIELTSSYGAYMILHYENDSIYGTQVDVRAMQNIKEDGTYEASSAADSNRIRSVKFAGYKMQEKDLAVNDGIYNIYQIDGKDADMDSIDTYFANFANKKNVEFTNYSK